MLIVCNGDDKFSLLKDSLMVETVNPVSKSYIGPHVGSCCLDLDLCLFVVVVAITNFPISFRKLNI